jgi:hypothetical protein
MISMAPDLTGSHSQTGKIGGKIDGDRGQQGPLDRHVHGSTATDSELAAILSASLTAELHREIEALRSSDDAAKASGK